MTYFYRYYFFVIIIIIPTQYLYGQNIKKNNNIEINFQQGLTKLINKNASLLYNKANLLTFKGYKEESDYALVPQISILSFIAPNFSSTGNALKSKRDYSIWGPTLSFQTQIIWPFYSFGKRGLAQKAAEQGLAAYKNLHKAKVNEIIFEYKKLYLSLITLKQFKKVIEEAKKNIDKILTEANKQYRSGEGKILRKDISQLKIYSLEIQKLEEEHSANQNSARLALAHLLGEKEMYGVKDNDFPDIGTDSLLLQRLIDLSFNKNSNLKGLKLGILARKNLLKIEKRGLLPIFFIGAQATVNYTSVRERQQSSFANDPHNAITAGIAAGLKWDFNWGKYQSNIKKSQAKYEQLLAKQKEADTGYPLEISLAFWNMKKNKKNQFLSQKKLKEARRWSMAELTAHSAGIGSAKDLVQSLATYYLSKREIIEAEYKYLLSWATLSLKVGEISMLKHW